jgi:5'(3')-deoxyribonucleotidase
VLVDCDGVLADFIGGVLPIINAMFDTNYVHSDVWQFDIAASIGLSKEDASRMKREIGYTPRLAAGLAVLPGAVDGMRRLREIAEVYIVTSSWDSNETWEFDRKGWLKRNFGIHHHEIVFTAAKHVCTGDVLIDDKTSTCEKWQDEHPRDTAILWSTPHNRRDTWAGWSTSSWDQLLAWVGAW